MKINDILNEMRTLAMSQGFYGRLYKALIECRENDPEQWENVVEELEGQNFSSALDMIFYFEC